VPLCTGFVDRLVFGVDFAVASVATYVLRAAKQILRSTHIPLPIGFQVQILIGPFFRRVPPLFLVRDFVSFAGVGFVFLDL